MGAVIGAVVWALAGLASIPLVLMTPFLFDAPGSESSPLTEALAIAIAVLPLFFAAGGILRWVLHRPAFFLLPLLDVAAIIAIVIAIESYCGGALSCQ